MRLTLKHQMILAPAAVLLLLSLLLGFLQYTYWDLSVKREEARNIGTVFIALAEADLATRRLQALVERLGEEHLVDVACLETVADLYAHLDGAVERILVLMPLPEQTRSLLQQARDDLDPEHGFDLERYRAATSLLRPQLVTLSELIQAQRERLRQAHGEDIDDLVARTALVSTVVLGAAILIGIFLALTFARSILRRIQSLSDCAGRIVRGDFTAPPAPAVVRDEFDELAVSISSMTDQLIRVVGTEKLLEGAEEERRRIAMDIHDQTLADISSVLRGVQEIRRDPACPEGAAALEEDLQRVMTNLREVMDNLHPQALDILGLGAALESHLERHFASEHLPSYHFYCGAEVDGAPLSRVARLNVYRICVEAVHNLIKHARASRYEVNLDLRGGALVLSVEDNGVGFALPSGGSVGGRGLNNIRERARAIGASASWGASRFSSGTRFELVVPLGNGTAKE